VQATGPKIMTDQVLLELIKCCLNV